MSATLGQLWTLLTAIPSLWLAIAASLLLHALPLSLHFKFPDA